MESKGYVNGSVQGVYLAEVGYGERRRKMKRKKDSEEKEKEREREGKRREG